MKPSSPETPIALTGATRREKIKAEHIERRISTCMPREWSEAEKLNLALSLEKYGILEMDKVVNDVPTKTPAEVRLFVESVMRRTRQNVFIDFHKEGMPLPKAAIDMWLSWIAECQGGSRDEFGESLAKTYYYMSRYEPHPDPEDSDGIDFGAMYEFLYLAFGGHPVKAVNPSTARAIFRSLEELKLKMGIYGTEKEVEHIQKVSRLVFVGNSSMRHYGRKVAVNKKPSGPMEKLLDIKGFNPMNIPYELLKRRTKNSTTPSSSEPVRNIFAKLHYLMSRRGAFFCCS